MDCKDAGRRGGSKTKELYGPAYYEAIQAKSLAVRRQNSIARKAARQAARVEAMKQKWIGEAGKNDG